MKMSSLASFYFNAIAFQLIDTSNQIQTTQEGLQETKYTFM